MSSSRTGYVSRWFQSTHPSRGATFLFGVHRVLRDVSIHAPLAGCDQSLLHIYQEFQVSIHAPLAGCDFRKLDHRAARQVSIHAPLAGCDGRRRSTISRIRRFNPRTPRGVRRGSLPVYNFEVKFQSTHPSRGATESSVWEEARSHVSIHAPLAGCDDCRFSSSLLTYVSIHAPLAGCDRARSGASKNSRSFNPRTPRGVRLVNGKITYPQGVSIHAPLAGCDSQGKSVT